MARRQGHIILGDMAGVPRPPFIRWLDDLRFNIVFQGGVDFL